MRIVEQRRMETLLIALLAGTVLLAHAHPSAGALTAEQKCQRFKLKAAGKLQLCLQNNTAGLLVGKSDGAALCRGKFITAVSNAESKTGTACHYIDNGDGTVSDLNTGLMWEKKSATCPGAHCVTDTYTWCTGTYPTCAQSGDPADGTAFTTFLFGLNGNSQTVGVSVTGCFNGHCDWRIPTLTELAGILDTTLGACGGGSGPCLDPVFGPTGTNYYWTSSTYSSGPIYGATVDFGLGNDNIGLDKPNPAYVRAVRGGF